MDLKDGTIKEMSENPSTEAIQAFLTQAGMGDTYQMFNDVFDRLSGNGDLTADDLVQVYEPHISALTAAQQAEVRAWILGMASLPGMR